ncbi:Firmicu-CTERM sorting domain-containing protein [Weissella cibaria]|uniref:Firmicu-CTERM sorting domain-containing protein n=1 Tax=Weissella cibaria TaxID=137591 RepID=UPI00106EA30C|nr:Firmicu-CTERM sorting domain-containing protein [Weissella cibaria]
MIKKWLLMVISAVLIGLGVGINQPAYATVDFDSIPLSELRFPYDGFNVHQWGMVMDDDKIALVLNMNPKGTGQGYGFQGSGYQFKLADQVVYMDMASGNSAPTKLGESASVTFNLYNATTGLNHQVTGKIVVRDAPNNNTTQILMIEIPIADMVSNPALVGDIELTNGNLGSQSVVVSGASTEPIVAATLGGVIVLVLGILIFQSHRR